MCFGIYIEINMSLDKSINEDKFNQPDRVSKKERKKEKKENIKICGNINVWEIIYSTFSK